MKRLIFAALIFIFPLISSAHPHVWIDSEVTVDGDSVRLVWLFDEMFSNVILSDYDKDGNKKITASELGELKQGMFDYLVNFDYFLSVFCGEKPVAIGDASGFKAYVKGMQVIYDFNVKIPASSCRQELQIFNFDSSYYSDITVRKAFGRGVKMKEDDGGRKYLGIR